MLLACVWLLRHKLVFSVTLVVDAAIQLLAVDAKWLLQLAAAKSLLAAVAKLSTLAATHVLAVANSAVCSPNYTP